MNLTTISLVNLICIAEVAEEGVHLPSGVEAAFHLLDDPVAEVHHSFPPEEVA
jgi:hypothetical protein